MATLVDATFVCNQCGDVFTRPVENSPELFDRAWEEIWQEHEPHCEEKRDIMTGEQLLTHYEWVEKLKQEGKPYVFPPKVADE